MMTMVPGADGGGSGVGSGSGVAFSVSFAPAPGSAGSCSSCFHPSTPLGPKACSQAQKISDNVKHFPSPIVTTKTHLPIRSTSSLSHGELKLSRKTFLQVFGVLFQLCVCVWRIFLLPSILQTRSDPRKKPISGVRIFFRHLWLSCGSF